MPLKLSDDLSIKFRLSLLWKNSTKSFLKEASPVLLLIKNYCIAPKKRVDVQFNVKIL